MNRAQYKFTGTDESYTYSSMILPLIPFIEKFRKRKEIENKKDLVIWCPFDLRNDTYYNDILIKRSNYVIIFEHFGYTVVSSHIAEGKDFFNYQPDYFDIIISNPPFRNKKSYFLKAMDFKKPFALLCMATWLNDPGSFNVFSNFDLQLLMPDKRSNFFNSEGKPIKGRISFKSIYYCYDFLEKNIQWFKIDKKLEKKPYLTQEEIAYYFMKEGDLS